MLGYLGLQRKIKSAPANEIMQFLIFFLAKSCIICNRFIGINWKLELLSVYTFEKMLTCLPKKDDKSIQSSEIVHCLKSSPDFCGQYPFIYLFSFSSPHNLDSFRHLILHIHRSYLDTIFNILSVFPVTDIIAFNVTVLLVHLTLTCFLRLIKSEDTPAVQAWRGQLRRLKEPRGNEKNSKWWR